MSVIKESLSILVLLLAYSQEIHGRNYKSRYARQYATQPHILRDDDSNSQLLKIDNDLKNAQKEESEPSGDILRLLLSDGEDLTPLLTRSNTEALEQGIESAAQDLKQRLQIIAGNSMRKQANNKITFDQKFTSSIIDSVVYYAKKQMYVALKSWVDKKMTDSEAEIPPKIDE